MAFEIEIIEGHDPSSYFCFYPVKIERKEKIIWWEDVYYFDDEICIEEGDIECFLAFFFEKYFDKELFYNKHRYDPCEGFITDFEWWVDKNFYTYEAMSKMLSEIEHTALLLANDYDNESLAPIKEKFSIYYMCESGHSDRERGNDAVRDHIGVVIDFYNRFAARMRKMMRDNPQTDLISINGP